MGSRAEVHDGTDRARNERRRNHTRTLGNLYGGYAGGFSDLDRHAWEVAHHQGFGIGDDGSVIIPTGDTPAAVDRSSTRSPYGLLTRHASSAAAHALAWRSERPGSAFGPVVGPGPLSLSTM